MKTQIYNDTILKITRPTLKINDHVVLSENLHVVQTTTGQLSFSRLTEDQKTLICKIIDINKEDRTCILESNISMFPCALRDLILITSVEI
jgi:hypothetical protein